MDFILYLTETLSKLLYFNLFCHIRCVFNHYSIFAKGKVINGIVIFGV